MWDPDTILTDEQGRPIPRPQRENYATLAQYCEAMHRFEVYVHTVANRAFDRAFRAALRAP